MQSFLKIHNFAQIDKFRYFLIGSIFLILYVYIFL